LERAPTPVKFPLPEKNAPPPPDLGEARTRRIPGLKTSTVANRPHENSSLPGPPPEKLKCFAYVGI